MQERILQVFLVRNSKKDIPEKNKIGFDILWESGEEVNHILFDNFCKIGMRLIFGKSQPEHDKAHKVNFILSPVSPDYPFQRLKKRFYLSFDGNDARIHLPDGTETDILFNGKSHTEILKWLGWNDLRVDENSWFDLAATRDEGYTLGSKMPQVASNHKDTACLNSTLHQEISSV